jgi:hypothetical protein
VCIEEQEALGIIPVFWKDGTEETGRTGISADD